MNKPIAIIGGMGPQASLRFHKLLIAKSQHYHSGDGKDFPYIAHFSLPVDDFISDTSKESAALQTVDNLIDTFTGLEPQIVTLACNTAHLLVSRSAVLQLPEFVSMIETVGQTIADTGIYQVGLLASPNTVQTKLYESILLRHGIATIRPSTSELAQLEQVIRHIIAGTSQRKDSSTLTRIAQSLARKGAEAILLGCTELPLVFDAASCPVPVHDCLDIYAERTIRQYYNITE